MSGKANLQNNFKIMFEGLQKAIEDYLEYGTCTGRMEYVEAYLVATIHALMDYADRFLLDDDEIMACRYVNNTIKHVAGYVTHKEVTGGVTFPITFPLACEEIKVVWKSEADLACRYEDQKKAYIKCFAGKSLLDTLTPLANKIEQGIDERKSQEFNRGQNK